MRKIICLLCMVLILCSCIVVNANAEKSTYLCDGTIDLTGTINSARTGDIVTAMVFNNGGLWQDETYWKKSDDSNIVYCKESPLDQQRSYHFKFYLDNSGIYSVYIGSKEFSEIYDKTIVYVNKQKNDSVLTKISQVTTEADLAKILTDYKSDIGLFGEYYDDINYNDVAKILLPYTQKRDLDYESTICAIDKACVCSQINSSAITEVESVKDYLHMDETETKFYRKEYSKEICSMLHKNKLDTIDNFEKSLRDAIVLCTINQNDGLGDIKEILNCYSDKYDIEKSKITTDICSALVKKANSKPFNNVKEVATYINNYSPSGTGTTGGVGGNAGGSSNNHLKGIEMPVYKNEDNQTDRVFVFDDISDVEWANEAITELYYKGIINGTSDKNFEPHKNVKRDEFAKILAKAFKIDLVSEKQYFDDVSPNDWCYDYVNSLYISGVVNGISDRLFGKEEDITRQDICVMICRIVDVVKGDINQVKEKSEFTDGFLISDYAKESVLKMQIAGILSGYEDGTFNPMGKATRVEAAKLVYETLLNVKY